MRSRKPYDVLTLLLVHLSRAVAFLLGYRSSLRLDPISRGINLRSTYPALTVLCLLAPVTADIAAATQPSLGPKRVLLLHPSSGSNLMYARTIRAELDRQSSNRLEIVEASFLTGRPNDDSLAQRYGDYLQNFFTDQTVDLAIAIGGASVRLFHQYHSRLFPTTPLLAIAEERQLHDVGSAKNETAIATSINFTNILDNILQVLPETRNVTVVIGNSSIEQYWVAQMRAAFQPFNERVLITWSNNLLFDDILKKVATLPPRSAIIFVMMLSDAADVSFEDTTAFSKLYALANAPIFSVQDATFGSGIVGGPLISVQSKSQLAASTALRILAGEVAGDLNVQRIGFSSAKFDWRQMQRWQISEKRLPPGSEIQFRPPTAWELYLPQFISVSAAILFQAALISWLMYEHRRRHLAEVLARNTMAEIMQLNRLATAGELSATIAHEVNQPLTGIATRAGAALRWLSAEVPNIEKARNALDQIVSASHRASDIITSVRAMFHKTADNTRPIDINALILEVLALLRLELERLAIDVHLQLRQGLPPVEGDKVQLQQVIVNLIMNAIDSMQSMQVRELRIQSNQPQQGMIHVSVEDSGTGIDPSDVDRVFKPLYTTKSHGMGMGLSICQSMIERHNGTIWMSPSARRGSVFHFNLPCSSQTVDANNQVDA